MIVNCVLCGAEVEAVKKNKKYCSECKEKMRLIALEKKNEANKLERRLKIREKKWKPCRRLCKTCVYFTVEQMCGYCYYTGRMRNSEPEKCDKYLVRNRENRKIVAFMEKRQAPLLVPSADEVTKYFGDKSKKQI